MSLETPHGIKAETKEALPTSPNPEQQNEQVRLAGVALGGLIGDVRYQKVDDFQSLQEVAGDELSKTRELLSSVSVEEQNHLAENLFQTTIGNGLDAVRYMTPVYMGYRVLLLVKSLKNLKMLDVKAFK